WWTMQDREPLDHWTRGAITLIGDAAHPMLQYIAQGACQALEDAAHLAAEVARAPGAPADAFRSYQAARAPRAARVQRTARTWGEICHTDGIGATLRNALLARRGDGDYEDVDWLYGHRPEDEAPSPAPSMATLGTPPCPGSGEDP
ncbi:MAG TPA: FAD-dependent monooxygenase, partial [Acidimicrobiales bacterium]|nr:FAD-dependent monooxygenase [Acidimicrobiales bacterium]